MAMFREHVAVGATVSVAIVTCAYTYALMTDPLMLTVLFVSTTVASFLPDLDSDTGTPFYLLFGAFTLLCTGGALYVALQVAPHDWRMLVGVPAVTMLGVWVIVGTIFKHLTEHRGMMHSLPSAAIAGIATFLVARYWDAPVISALIFGGSVAIGYVSHLILDEIWAGVNLSGIPFIPKRSLGTATKLFSDSAFMNVATYGVLAGLVYLAYHSYVVA